MAKLSARGATIVAAAERKHDATETLSAYTEKVALRSDGKTVRNFGSGWHLVTNRRPKEPVEWRNWYQAQGFAIVA